jgi:hypothetical protein
MAQHTQEQKVDILEQLKRALASHDWYFDFSDDHQTWHRGQQSLANIRQLQQQCQAQGLGEAADQLYQQYRR